MSIFNRHHQPFAVPLLAFERFSELRQQLTDDAQVLESAVIPTLAECCGMPQPTADAIEYFIERLEAAGREADSLSNPSQPTPGKTLGSAYAAALRELDTAGLILYMCAFDFHKANYVYTQLDRDVALKMLDHFLALKGQENNLLFEACLYGFGGKYDADGGSAEVVTVDLSSEDNFNMLAQLFAKTH